MRRLFSLLALLPAALFAQSTKPMPPGETDNPELAAMNATLNKHFEEKKYHEAFALAKTNRAKILGMIAGDKLTTKHDFLWATTLLENSQWYEDVRLAHEAALMALLLKAPNAGVNIKRTWDGLLISLGRKQRLNSMVVDPKFDADGRYNPDPTLKGVLEALKTDFKPGLSDNKELQDLRTADQAARQAPMGDMSDDALHKMAADDVARQNKVKDMLEKGEVTTGKDFEAASLILQHSSVPDGYALAHECAIASVLLGYDEAAWLLSRTYDRYLVSLGHRQRYGTQWNQDGLIPMDDLGINDRMRLQMRTYTLADLKTKGAARAKQELGGG